MPACNLNHVTVAGKNGNVDGRHECAGSASIIATDDASSSRSWTQRSVVDRDDAVIVGTALAAGGDGRRAVDGGSVLEPHIILDVGVTGVGSIEGRSGQVVGEGTLADQCRVDAVVITTAASTADGVGEAVGVGTVDEAIAVIVGAVGAVLRTGTATTESDVEGAGAAGGAIPARHADPVLGSAGDGDSKDLGAEVGTAGGIAVTCDLIEGIATAVVNRQVSIEVDATAGADTHGAIGGRCEGVPAVLVEVTQEGTGTLSITDGVSAGGHRRGVDGVGSLDDDDGGITLIACSRGQAGRAAEAIGVVAVCQPVAVIVDSIGAQLDITTASSGQGIDEQLTGVGRVEPGTEAQRPRTGEATVVIGEVVSACGTSAAQLTDDPVILVEEGRSRGTGFGGSQVPVVDGHEVGRKARRLVLEGDTLLLGIRVVNADGTAGGCAGGIPSAEGDAVGGVRRARQFHQREVRGGRSCAEDRSGAELVEDAVSWSSTGGGSGRTTGRVLVVPVHHQRSSISCGHSAVICGHEVGGAILCGVVHHEAGAEEETT